MNKFTKKIFVLYFAVIFLSAGAFAQQTLESSEVVSKTSEVAVEQNSKYESECKNGIGAFMVTPFHWGYILTEFLYGICYQRWITSDFSIEGGGMLIGTGYDDFRYNMYVECDWTFFSYASSENFATRLFLWGLIGHVGVMKKNTWIPSVYDENHENIITEGHYANPEYEWMMRLSLGVGFDMVIAQHLSIPLKCGVSASFDGLGFTFGTAIKYLW